MNLLFAGFQRNEPCFQCLQLFLTKRSNSPQSHERSNGDNESHRPDAKRNGGEGNEVPGQR
jgi:hypothetical protein